MDQPAIKVVLIGDSTVGKSSIFRRLESKTYDHGHILTIGGSFVSLPLDLPDGTKTEVGLWDTAGHEKFRTIVPMYFQKADILLIVFDITNRDSFQSIDGWINLAKQKAPLEIRILLVGNKVDLEDRRKVTDNEGHDKADTLDGSRYIEVSALSGSGFDLLRSELSRVSGICLEERALIQIPPAPILPNLSQEKPKCC